MRCAEGGRREDSCGGASLSGSGTAATWARDRFGCEGEPAIECSELLRCIRWDGRVESDRVSGTPSVPSCELGCARARRPVCAVVGTGAGVGAPASTEGWRSLLPRLLPDHRPRPRCQLGAPAPRRRRNAHAPGDVGSDVNVRQKVHAVVPRERLAAFRSRVGIVPLPRSRLDRRRFLPFFSCR